MEVLEQLADDLYAYSGELFRGPGADQYGDVRQDPVGIQKVGRSAREYIHETAAIAINFSSRAGDMEAELESSEALKFREAVNGMKESIRDLIRPNCFSRGVLQRHAAANFDNILVSVSDEVKEFI